MGKEEKRFKGAVKKGEVRNPYGRSGKPQESYKKVKDGFVKGFMDSDAMGHLVNMLNMRLPAILKPRNRELLTDEEDKEYRKLALTNFKWVVEQILKVVPKEIGIFGKVQHDHTIAGMVKQATIAPKSNKVIDLVKTEKEKRLLEEKEEETIYEMGESLEEEEDE